MTKARYPEYSYNCVDYSITLGFFKKYYVAHYYKWVPQKITANQITLISCSALWVLFAMVWEPGGFAIGSLALWFSLLIHFYIVGDHLDGMHAKETGTSSPLGEFIDHYLDIYNSAILIAACFVFIRIDSPWVYYGMLWISYLAFAATMVEQKERGELYFGPIGSLEGLFLIQAFFVTWVFPAGRELWRSSMWNDFTWEWAIVIVGALGCLFTVLDILIRLKRSPVPFNVFGVASLALCYVLVTGTQSQFTGWWFLAFYCGNYTGQVMKSYFLNTAHEMPDKLSTLGIFILLTDCAFPFLGGLERGFFISLGTYMGGLCLLNFVRILVGFKKYWLWSNPAPSNAEVEAS